jgi:hypothetical protein
VASLLKSIDDTNSAIFNLLVLLQSLQSAGIGSAYRHKNSRAFWLTRMA